MSSQTATASYIVTYATYNADDEPVGVATCGHRHVTEAEARECAESLHRAGVIRHLDSDEWEINVADEAL